MTDRERTQRASARGEEGASLVELLIIVAVAALGLTWAAIALNNSMKQTAGRLAGEIMDLGSPSAASPRGKPPGDFSYVEWWGGYGKGLKEYFGGIPAEWRKAAPTAIPASVGAKSFSDIPRAIDQMITPKKIADMLEALKPAFKQGSTPTNPVEAAAYAVGGPLGVLGMKLGDGVRRDPAGAANAAAQLATGIDYASLWNKSMAGRPGEALADATAPAALLMAGGAAASAGAGVRTVTAVEQATNERSVGTLLRRLATEEEGALKWTKKWAEATRARVEMGMGKFERGLHSRYAEDNAALRRSLDAMTDEQLKTKMYEMGESANAGERLIPKLIENGRNLPPKKPARSVEERFANMLRIQDEIGDKPGGYVSTEVPPAATLSDDWAFRSMEVYRAEHPNTVREIERFGARDQISRHTLVQKIHSLSDEERTAFFKQTEGKSPVDITIDLWDFLRGPPPPKPK